MRKIFLVLIMGLFVFSIAGVSATTLINGVIYSSNHITFVSGANVSIACTHRDIINYKNSISISDGSYGASFLESKCDEGDSVTVIASKGDLSGIKTKVVQNKIDYPGVSVNLAVVNVAMTPEFGFFLGTLTLISVVGIFFVVRRD